MMFSALDSNNWPPSLRFDWHLPGSLPANGLPQGLKLRKSEAMGLGKQVTRPYCLKLILQDLLLVDPP